MSQQSERCDVVVIGKGPGGSPGGYERVDMAQILAAGGEPDDTDMRR